MGCSDTGSFLAHNFVLHGSISELFGANDHVDKTICCMQDPFSLLEGQGHTVP